MQTYIDKNNDYMTDSALQKQFDECYPLKEQQEQEDDDLVPEEVIREMVLNGIRKLYDNEKNK